MVPPQRLSYDRMHADVQHYQFPEEYLHWNWVAILRGGAVLAQMLGFKYDKRFGTVDPLTGQFFRVEDYAHTLIIEDVIKTGSTIARCREVMGDFKILVYLYDPSFTEVIPDLYIVKTTTYIQLPWEDEATEP